MNVQEQLKNADKMIPCVIDGINYEYNWITKEWEICPKNTGKYEDSTLGWQ